MTNATPDYSAGSPLGPVTSPRGLTRRGPVLEKRAPREAGLTDAYAHTDRRSRPTPMLSRYWLRGRRREAGRREGDSRHIYVDRYSQAEWAMTGWLTLASLSDLGLTILHLRDGGTEANPIMDWFLVQGGTLAFAVAKILLPAIPVLFLLVHARFRGTWPALMALSAMYLVLLGYHALAAWDRLAH